MTDRIIVPLPEENEIGVRRPVHQCFLVDGLALFVRQPVRPRRFHLVLCNDGGRE